MKDKNNVVEVSTTDVVKVENVQALKVDDHDTNLMNQMDLGSYYSFIPKTKDEKIKLYNAINNPDERLADHINMKIKVKHILVEIVEIVQESSGELVKCPRVVLIDENFKSYACVSVGVMSGLKKIIKFFGEPSTWDEPVEVMVKQVSKNEKKMLTLVMV